MLEFVGLGLYDAHSITERGSSAIASADTVYLEAYTSVLAGTGPDQLEAHHGREITLVNRGYLERSPDALLDRAEDEHVVLLVGGDPMVATTHVDLRLRAAERGIDTSIVHGTSISTAAAGLCGLQVRRFGKATTVPRPGQFGGEGAPPSVIETIEANRDRGLHTLVYLDIELGDVSREDLEGSIRERCLDGATAAAELAVTMPQQLAIAVARAGSEDPLVQGGRLETLADVDLGPPLHLLVIPGRLHDLEAAALVEFADVSPDVVESLQG